MAKRRISGTARERRARVEEFESRILLSADLPVAALLLALSAASYFALSSRSRKGMFLLTIASLAYFGFWREGWFV